MSNLPSRRLSESNKEYCLRLTGKVYTASDLIKPGGSLNIEDYPVTAYHPLTRQTMHRKEICTMSHTCNYQWAVDGYSSSIAGQFFIPSEVKNVLDFG